MESQTDHQRATSATQLASILQKGLNLHRQGDLKQAEQHYRQILDVSPMNADALHLLGVLSNQKQENNAAIDLITQAIQIFPHQPIYHNNLGNALRDCGRYREALDCYHKALQLKPDLIGTLINIGITYHQLADFQQAASAYRDVIALKPDSAEAYYNLGNTFKEQRRFDDAICCYQQAAALNPLLIEASYNLAAVLQKKGRFESAIAFLKRCIDVRPDWAEAHCNLGHLYVQRVLFDDAIGHYQEAIRLKPELDEAHNNLGNAFKDQGRFGEAIACYQRALRIRPFNTEVHSNLGVTYAAANRMAEALNCFQEAIQLNPRFAEAHNFMGLVLTEQGRRDQAIDCFQKAIDIKPNFAEAHSYLIHQLQYTCNWRQLKIYSEKLDNLFCKTVQENTRMVEPPFIGMTRQGDSRRHLQNSKAWSRKIAHPFQKVRQAFAFNTRLHKTQKLTIGYLSGDFHDHATAHLMQSMFGLHDREKFKIHCYSYGPEDHSHYRQQIVRQCDQFVDIRDLPTIDAARRIYADGVDILVDLKGHTQGARLGIPACRPAPLQVHYLGYPGTTGADFIDYFVTDKIVTPIEHAPFSSEKLVFLPHSYQVNDHRQKIAVRIPTKQEQGLPDRGRVFSSFNLPYKIDPLMFDCWMRILDQIPDSVLWLFDGGKAATKNLEREATRRGIDPQRLVFAEKLPKAEHLARLKLADLALDTRIINGHTTTSDSLWAGVPVITLLGDHFASRVSASLLSAVGLSELIVDHLDAYERLAVRLANQPDELQQIKTKLAANRLTEPLFDTHTFVGHLETAYQKMWRIFTAGDAPQQFEVIAD
ncbi:MAG: tetratricopeptide repeat protein [Desulfobacterales bacterium]